MKNTVTLYDFERAFVNAGRKDQFTYDAKKALFEYLEQYEEDCDTEIELDVIALCCEYTEYENLKEFQDNYGEKFETLDDIRDETTVIEIDDDAFIIQDF